MNHSPTEGAQGSANSETPITAHQAQDAIMPSQTVLDAANRFSRENWTNGLRLAGADSSYVAYWSFCAGARQLAQSQERVKALTEGLDKLTAWGMYCPDWADRNSKDEYAKDFMAALALLSSSKTN